MGTCSMIRTFGFVTLLAIASVQCAKIHEQMTDDEIANLFRTTRDNIPEYDIVPIRHNLYKRSEPNLRMQFNAFGQKIDTYLEPSDSQLAGQNTPVWLAFTNSNGTIEYKKMRDDIVGIVAGFFNSPIDLSTVIVRNATNKDNPSFEGVVDDMLVRPLPEKFQDPKRFKQNVEASNGSRTLLETHYHLIIKSPSIKEEQKLRLLERQILEASRSVNDTDTSKVKRSSADIVYPSILVRTDFKGSKTTLNDLAYYDEIMYQLAFWNGVDLRFRKVSNPKVRLRIAGIIIGQDRNATPYMNNHRFRDAVKVSEGWSDMVTYWKEMGKRADFPLTAYDIVVTMTDYNMIGNTGDGNRYVLGLADLRSLCKSLYNRYQALAVIVDKGGFDGILTAAHELGHVMGLFHDVDRGDECDASHGFLMQPEYLASLNNLQWSTCSLKMLSVFLRDSNTDCIDEPAEFHHPGPAVQKILPGVIVDIEKQCQGRGFSVACTPDPEMCTRMYCKHTGWNGFTRGWWCKNSGPAAEGTICAPDHKCIDGVCQCLRENCIFENKKT